MEALTLANRLSLRRAAWHTARCCSLMHLADGQGSAAEAACPHLAADLVHEVDVILDLLPRVSTVHLTDKPPQTRGWLDKACSANDQNERSKSRGRTSDTRTRQGGNLESGPRAEWASAQAARDTASVGGAGWFGPLAGTGGGSTRSPLSRTS